eukprot:SM000116S24255  [mRNA]  locus=s116:290893:291423:+ [translate_table: standard]
MERAAAARLLVLAVLAVTAMRGAGNATAIGLVVCFSASNSLGMEADWPADKHKHWGWPLMFCAGILPAGALRLRKQMDTMTMTATDVFSGATHLWKEPSCSFSPYYKYKVEMLSCIVAHMQHMQPQSKAWTSP